jgi:hypothetical protein
MKTKLITGILALAMVIPFTGCMKKGEDDPFMSFRSRKSRAAGEWKLTSYTLTSTDPSGVSTINSNGSTYTYTDPITTATGSWTQDITLEKDGTYKMNLIVDGNSEISEGTWNFTTGVGDLKNKSQITIYSQKDISGGNTATWTGNYVDIAYDLLELRNKKMVWHNKVTYTNSSGATYTDDETYVWEAK